MVKTFHFKDVTSDVTPNILIGGLINGYDHILEMSEGEAGSSQTIEIKKLRHNNARGVLFITPPGVPGLTTWLDDPTIAEYALDIENGSSKVQVGNVYGQILSDGTVISQKTIPTAPDASQDVVKTHNPGSGVWQMNDEDYRMFFMFEFTKPSSGPPVDISINVGTSISYWKFDL